MAQGPVQGAKGRGFGRVLNLARRNHLDLGLYRPSARKSTSKLAPAVRPTASFVTFSSLSKHYNYRNTTIASCFSHLICKSAAIARWSEGSDSEGNPGKCATSLSEGSGETPLTSRCSETKM